MASRHSATYSGDLGDHSCVCAATRDVHHALLYQAGHKSWSRYNALCQPPQPEPPIASIAVDTTDHTPTSAGSSTKSRPAGAAKPTAAAYPQTNTRPSAFTTAVCAYPHATRTSWRRKSAQQPSRRLVSRHTARCSPTARTHNVPETCQTSARAWALAQTAHHVRRRRSGARDRTGPRN